MYFLTQKINVSARHIGKTKNNSVLSKKQKPIVLKKGCHWWFHLSDSGKVVN